MGKFCRELLPDPEFPNGTKLSAVCDDFAGSTGTCLALSGLGPFRVGYPGLRSFLASPWAGLCRAFGPKPTALNLLPFLPDPEFPHGWDDFAGFPELVSPLQGSVRWVGNPGLRLFFAPRLADPPSAALPFRRLAMLAYAGPSALSRWRFT